MFMWDEKIMTSVTTLIAIDLETIVQQNTVVMLY